MQSPHTQSGFVTRATNARWHPFADLSSVADREVIIVRVAGEAVLREALDAVSKWTGSETRQ